MKMIFAMLLPALFLLAACDPPQASSQGRTQLEKQREQAAATALVNQTECNECKNIQFKREMLGKPGLVGYVTFLSYDGRPIQYITVKGKCTSGNKRLEKSYEFIYNSNAGTPSKEEMVPGPSDDGTYGTSGEYIYCHTTNDAYVQWNGPYLYSTQPYDLTIKPIVIDQSGKDQAQ